MHKILQDTGVQESMIIHWSRLVLSAIYGYSALHQNGQLTLPVSTKESIDYIITVLVTEINGKTSIVR